ncbi:hypothetical protein CYMTET_35236 [Cymbomonas tetramitiformis]|uniref:Uncharacterized protein n=1 Tax=Cymbomonas tetramitiformis TaxID=36881 RepID=A0AAE0F9G2_9CHLO|nr:hypothetical protein CYMTET_35236 [Cymbomonas tetramitiformis]
MSFCSGEQLAEDVKGCHRFALAIFKGAPSHDKLAEMFDEQFWGDEITQEDLVTVGKSAIHMRGFIMKNQAPQLASFLTVSAWEDYISALQQFSKAGNCEAFRLGNWGNLGIKAEDLPGSCAENEGAGELEGCANRDCTGTSSLDLGDLPTHVVPVVEIRDFDEIVSRYLDCRPLDEPNAVPLFYDGHELSVPRATLLAAVQSSGAAELADLLRTEHAARFVGKLWEEASETTGQPFTFEEEQAISLNGFAVRFHILRRKQERSQRPRLLFELEFTPGAQGSTCRMHVSHMLPDEPPYRRRFDLVVQGTEGDLLTSAFHGGPTAYIRGLCAIGIDYVLASPDFQWLREEVEHVSPGEPLAVIDIWDVSLFQGSFEDTCSTEEGVTQLIYATQAIAKAYRFQLGELNRLRDGCGPGKLASMDYLGVMRRLESEKRFIGQPLFEADKVAEGAPEGPPVESAPPVALEIQTVAQFGVGTRA